MRGWWVPRQRKAIQRLTIPPLPGHVADRGNAPGAVQRQLTVALQQHAHQLILQHVKPQEVTIFDLEFNKVIGLLMQRPVLQGFHRDILMG